MNKAGTISEGGVNRLVSTNLSGVGLMVLAFLSSLHADLTNMAQDWIRKGCFRKRSPLYAKMNGAPRCGIGCSLISPLLEQALMEKRLRKPLNCLFSRLRVV